MFFENTKLAPKDPILGLQEAFDQEIRKEKVDLSVGCYQDEKSKAVMFPSVIEAQKEVINKETFGHYLPIDGDPTFLDLYGALVFGKDLWEQNKNSICKMQTVAGTSALYLAAKLYAKEVGKSVYVPSPTWANHNNIFSSANLDIKQYYYYCHDHHHVDFEKLHDAISTIPKGSLVVFHTCCHNPTGADLTLDQWKVLAKLVKKQGLLPLFDMAYQGLAKGLEEDRKPISLFIDEGLQVLVAASCSKIFSLYCQRVGALYVFCKNNDLKEKVTSQLKKIARADYSNPPTHGAFIVSHILSDKIRTKRWEEDLHFAKSRIEKMRVSFVEAFSGKKDYRFLLSHRGLFSFTGLSKENVKILMEKYAIYMPQSGRINLSGLNSKNLNYVVEAILSVQ